MEEVGGGKGKGRGGEGEGVRGGRGGTIRVLGRMASIFILPDAKRNLAEFVLNNTIFKN